MPMITRIEDFFTDGCGRCDRFGTDDCSARIWGDGVAALRILCRGLGLTETVKWGHPCYTHADRNIALIGALRGDFRLSIFQAALLDDPAGLLTKAGPNSRHADTIRLTSAAEVERHAPAITALLTAAMRNAELGIRADKTPAQIDVPDELLDALDADIELADAFAALTPGRQRSYAINLSSAKTAATRIARIEKFRDRIIAGKGANER